MKLRDYELDEIVEQAFRAIADYDTAALRARTSWDDHTAAWAEADRLREIRNEHLTRLTKELKNRNIKTFDLPNGKKFKMEHGLPVQVLRGR